MKKLFKKLFERNDKIKLIKLENEYKFKEFYPDIKSLQRELLLIEDKILKTKDNRFINNMMTFISFMPIIISCIAISINTNNQVNLEAIYRSLGIICFIYAGACLINTYEGVSSKWDRYYENNMRKNIIENEIKERNRINNTIINRYKRIHDNIRR